MFICMAQRKWLFNRFRPQQGLLIMNGVYEINGTEFISFRPQQGLLIMNAKDKVIEEMKPKVVFPSPTGVTYYE